MFFSSASRPALSRAHVGNGDADSHALTTQAAGEVDVARHDRDTAGVERAQVGVGEHTDHVALGGLLRGGHGSALPAEAILLGGSELTDEALEGGLADQSVNALLELANLPQGYSSGPKTPNFLAGGAGSLDLLGSSLGGLLGLLGASHGVFGSFSSAKGEKKAKVFDWHGTKQHTQGKNKQQQDTFCFVFGLFGFFGASRGTLSEKLKAAAA